MTGYPLAVLAPILGLFADGVVHVLASRLTAGKRIAHCLLAGIAAGLLATAGVTAVALGGRLELDALALLGFNLATSLALAYGYFTFVNLNLTSLRIRLLHELWASPNGLSRTDILKLYNSRDLVDCRIVRLTASKQIREADGRFYTQPSPLLKVACIINLLKLVVLNRRPRQSPASTAKSKRPLAG